jgi:hypothetical protein
MLQELLKALSEQAVKASDLKAFRPPGEPESVYYLRDADGNVSRHDTEPPHRDHKAADLSAVVAFAIANKDASVFYNRASVVCLLEDSIRRDRITLPLTFSPQLAEVLRWGKALYASQGDLIRLLRTTFRNSMHGGDLFLKSIRTINFEAGSKLVSDQQTTKQSMTKEQIARLTGGADLPEEILLTFPIFDGVWPQLQGTVTVALDTDAAKQQFILSPIPGDAETAIRKAEAEIGLKLVTDMGDAPAAERVYYGAV